MTHPKNERKKSNQDNRLGNKLLSAILISLFDDVLIQFVT